MGAPSKYDAFARYLLLTTEAQATMVIVIGGTMGNGAARSEQPTADPELLELRRRAMVDVLRTLADDIEKGITQPDQPEHRRGSA